jgi:hypothetical protein
MLNNTVLLRKRHLAVAVSGALALFASLQASASTLRIAMTAADIPLTLGQPDQGMKATASPVSRCTMRWSSGIFHRAKSPAAWFRAWRRSGTLTRRIKIAGFLPSVPE